MNVLEVTRECIRAIESGDQIDAVYTDIRKGFDKIRHKYRIVRQDQWSYITLIPSNIRYTPREPSRSTFVFTVFQ